VVRNEELDHRLRSWATRATSSIIFVRRIRHEIECLHPYETMIEGRRTHDRNHDRTLDREVIEPVISTREAGFDRIDC
jgi:hypothetical protein